MTIPAYALTDDDLWTPAIVMNALVFAQRVSRAVPAIIGPRGDRAYWPDTADEENEGEVEEERLQPTRAEITQAEYVLLGFTGKDGKKRPAWLNGTLTGYPRQRKILARWSLWASFGKQTFDGITETEEEYAQRQHMSFGELRYQRDFAARLVAQSLNEAGLKVWHAEKPRRKANRQVSQSA